jgi:hypothetical protein
MVSDKDIKNNPRYKRYKAEREKTIEEITAILTNRNFNISLISDRYKKRALLTSIVSANEAIINLYTNLCADLYDGHSENSSEMDEICNHVKAMFKMNTEPYEPDEDDNSDDEARNNKAIAEAREKYETLIEIINKIKSKHVADTVLTLGTLEQHGNRLPDTAIENALGFAINPKNIIHQSSHPRPHPFLGADWKENSSSSSNTLGGRRSRRRKLRKSIRRKTMRKK